MSGMKMPDIFFATFFELLFGMRFDNQSSGYSKVGHVSLSL
jgi:hypothetical protein